MGRAGRHRYARRDANERVRAYLRACTLVGTRRPLAGYRKQKNKNSTSVSSDVFKRTVNSLTVGRGESRYSAFPAIDFSRSFSTTLARSSIGPRRTRFEYDILRTSSSAATHGARSVRTPSTDV